MGIDWKTIRGYAVIAAVGFGLLVGLYVSIPDFPDDAKAWELMLWGEDSQWWSEIAWIAGFVILLVSALHLISWNSEVRGSPGEQWRLKVFRCIWAIATGSVSFNYSVIYFRWTDPVSFFLKDSGGYLHGLFYLFTFFLGILVFAELLAYLSKLHKLHVQGRRHK